MKLREIAALLSRSGPPAPYGVRRLARCHSIDDLARLARRRLPAAVAGYLDGGGEDEYTLRRNRAAFDEIELVPRLLRDVHGIDTSTTILGSPVPAPIVLAPIGAPRLMHHEGEVAVARAANQANIPYTVGTLATVPMAQIAQHAGSAVLWFQLYVWGDRSTAKDLIAQAHELGYRALVLSVDVTVRSKRERELRAGLTLPTPHLTLRTMLDTARHPTWTWRFLTSEPIGFPNIDASGHGAARRDELFDGTVTWGDLEWIKDVWGGPLAIKGVLSPADARRAADAGADAVIVSNHGGRQLDHVPSTLEMLPAIVDAVGGRSEVLLDSGIRRGTDILVAIALGARAVLIGRAYLYGLAVAGEPGVRFAIDLLNAELRTALALIGARRVEAVDREMVRRLSQC
jgi:L-lactate dehydrogenase (cytochrome)